MTARVLAPVLVLLLLAGAVALASVRSQPREAAGDPVPAVPAKAWPTTVRRPAGPPVIATDDVDAMGRPVKLSCSSCHSVRPPGKEARRAEDLDEFHQGLTFVHGDLVCLSCHDPADYDRLRLADGSPVAYPDVMTLCAQCHGQKRTDYEHGAHGGMNGYWDLSRGPRTRNGCMDCHDPHAPAFPRMLPTFKPIDRFLTPPGPGRPDHE